MAATTTAFNKNIEVSVFSNEEDDGPISTEVGYAQNIDTRENAPQDYTNEKFNNSFEKMRQSSEMNEPNQNEFFDTKPYSMNL